MDDLDRKILELLRQNARMPVKDIAERIALTSPAVSSRIHKLENEGIIAGYTVVLRRPDQNTRVNALISVSAKPTLREELIEMLHACPEVQQCYHVTGDHSYMVRVSCANMTELEHLITSFQRLGQTSTQIILSTLVDRNGADALNL